MMGYKFSEVMYMYYLLFVILGFFAIIGIAHVALSVIYHCTKNDSADKFLVFVPKNPQSFEAEFVLRNAAAEINKYGNDISRIICIDNGMSEDAQKQCELICRDYDYVSVMTMSEFKKITDAAAQNM